VRGQLGDGVAPVTLAPMGHPRACDLPAPVLLAAVLAAEGLGFVVVGSAALFLRGFDLGVGDLDIVCDLDSDNLDLLCDTVGRYRLRPSTRPTAPALQAVDVWSAATIYGTLDVLIDRARKDGDSLREAAGPVRVSDVNVVVASADDAWALRHRFKSPADTARAVRS
jgi:hypothetical protein